MKKRALGLMLCICMSIGTLAGCSSGVSQAEYDKVVAERDALAQQLQEMQNSTADSTTNNTVNAPDDLEGKVEAYLNECPVEIVSFTSVGGDYTLKMANKTDKHIVDAVIFPYYYDADYLPVTQPVSGWGLLETLKAGGTTERGFLVEQGTAYAAFIIMSVDFADGSTWENPYYHDIYECYRLQISSDYSLAKSLDDWKE